MARTKQTARCPNKLTVQKPEKTIAKPISENKLPEMYRVPKYLHMLSYRILYRDTIRNTEFSISLGSAQDAIKLFESSNEQGEKQIMQLKVFCEEEYIPMPTHVYVLVFVHDISHGSVGQKIGAAFSREEALTTWRKWLSQNDEEKTVTLRSHENLAHQTIGPQIVKLTVDHVPNDIWGGKVSTPSLSDLGLDQ